MAESEKSRKESRPPRGEKPSERSGDRYSERPGDRYSERSGDRYSERSETVAAATAEVPIDPPKLEDGERFYEGMWLVDANVGRENFQKVLDGIKEVIEKSGGRFFNGAKWEERRLAYPIKKKKRGLYVITHFTSQTQNLVKLERNIHLSELVLRALITVDEDGPSITPPARSLNEFGPSR
ncbi:MAG: 30S ribosomal protein S6 [Planctomycetes bacterium]|nr:30S ribosomal protein S6 [Planctomycetota bacterium]